MRHGQSTHSMAGRALVERRKSLRLAENQQSTGHREEEGTEGSPMVLWMVRRVPVCFGVAAGFTVEMK